MLQQETSHLSAVKMIIDNNLLKNVDKIKDKDIYGIIRTLEVQRILKPILFDLLAAQFARCDTFHANLEHVSHILYVLALNPKLDSLTMIKTASNIFHQTANAAFYLYKHSESGLEKNHEVELPEGLMSEEQRSIVSTFI